MNTKVSKLDKLAMKAKNVVAAKDCKNIKGGAWVYCCIRNEWVWQG